MTTLKWQFDHSYARLPGMFYAEQAPRRATRPHLEIFNHALADEMGLDAEGVSPDEMAEMLSGNVLPAQAKPLAQAYAGHQFGHFTMLGDGRAILLGEHLTPDGQRFDVQFKGAGPTAFSRTGDGLAGLGPMLREYVISEAMHGLGIPTTRSLAVVRTGEKVWRETVLAGAVLTRVASSHLRVGTFQYAAARRDPAALATLIDYTLARHDPQLLEADNKALALLEAVIQRQVHLIVQWMRVGFVHGVMNTDNMTISGETIDYGPCAFMDRYDPKTVFSSIDHSGRYAYANQPAMAQWNLARLAEALLSQIDQDADRAVEKAEVVIHGFKPLYLKAWGEMMAAKLGLRDTQAEDQQLRDALIEQMRTEGLDYTGTFVALARVLRARLDGSEQHVSRHDTAQKSCTTAESFSQDMNAWVDRWLSRVGVQSGGLIGALDLMSATNPVYIARNHLVEQALAAATQSGDMKPLHELLQVLSRPYTWQVGREIYQQPGSEQAAPYQTFCGT